MRRDKPKQIRPQINKDGMPIISGAKEKEKKISKRNFSISRYEKSILFRKYKKEGINYEQAEEKIKNICDKLGSIYEKLKKKNLSASDIENKMKEEIVKYY